MNEEVGYVSPADFDAPKTAADGVKIKDEIDLSTMDEILVYLNDEIAAYKGTERLVTKKRHKDGFTLEQQLEVNQVLAGKLELIRNTIIATIEGIQEKYDERG